jgi:hypothetical protein
VLLRELFFQENAAAEVVAPIKAKVGRAFNHLEDLAFLHGTAGVLKALQHIETAVSDGGQNTRFKWDGAPQIYWGWTKEGEFILCGHNGWSRGGSGTSKISDFTSPRSVYNFILNKSGDTGGDTAKQAERQQFAAEFSQLYDIFKDATKPPRKGKEIYFYADGLFIKPPVAKNGVYELNPNLKSNTQYHIDVDTELGTRIADGAQAMIVGHGYFSSFGAPDSAQKPIQNFEKYMEPTTELIVVSPYYALEKPEIDLSQLTDIENNLKQDGPVIDQFLSPIDKVSNFKGIIYRYMNETASKGGLANVGDDFMTWVEAGAAGMVKSDNMKANIRNRINQVPAGVTTVFNYVKQIMGLKNQILSQLEMNPPEIRVLNSEGWVQYDTSGDMHAKLVPRHDVTHASGETLAKWTPR